MSHIMQDWTSKLGLRHQGVLVSAVRGCDTSAKGSPLKMMSQFYRAAILNAHCGDVRKAKSFMAAPRDVVHFLSEARAALREMDTVPTHYALHLIHAAQIVGGYHPDPDVRSMWGEFYVRACDKLHMSPESIEDMNHRLNKNEDDFAKDQAS